MTDLRTVLAEHLDPIPDRGGDLAGARAAGVRIRRRRRLAVGTGVAAALALVGGVAMTALDDEPATTVPDPSQYASLGALDFSEGARAYADPGRTVFLGGRELPARELDYLDTDAVATPYGIVFFDAATPMLLEPSGDVRALVEGPVDAPEDFHPTAKRDVTAPHVAWATMPEEGTATITVRDLVTGDDVASTEVGCQRCGDLVIEAFDGGVVFVRDADGTRTWDTETGEWGDFAGPATRVVDVRGGVVLYDGPAPTRPGRWRLVEGAVDSQLSHDGEHVLSWSSRLEPTLPGGDPVVLEEGPTDGGLGFWTFDTDGSVLVAAPDRHPDFTMYDCVLPTGRCEELGRLTTRSGDPEFVGNDM